MRRPGARRPGAQDLRWVVAFVAACLALLSIKTLFLSDEHPSDAHASVGRQAVPAVRPAIASPAAASALGRIWNSRPSTPRSFTDPALVAPSRPTSDALSAAVALSAWPDISNRVHLENVAGLVQACDDVAAVVPLCVAGPTPPADHRKVALLVGDDSMQAYWMMLRPIFAAHGWTVVDGALTGCPAALVDGGSSCARHHRTYPRMLARWRPSLVLMSDSEGQAATAYAEGLRRAVALAERHAARVLVLSPPPARPGVAACQQDGRTPAQCAGPPYATWFALNRVQRRVAATTGARYADLLPFFCHRLVCPSIVPGNGSTIAVRGDYLHLSPEYAQFLRASFERYLLREGFISWKGARAS